MNYIKNHYVITGSYFWWFMAFLTGGSSIIWGFILWPYAIALIFVGGVILTVQTLGALDRSKLRRIVLQELQTSPKASINELRTSTGITKGDLRAIILDLKADRLFNDTTSTNAVQVEREPIQVQPVMTQEISTYCPNCGSPLSGESDQYCSYCGTKI
jgi:hypothetical protein